MAATKLAAIGDAIEAAFIAALASQSPAVPVYRGGGQWLTSAADPDFVVIGHDGSRDVTAAPPSAELQEPAGQGGGWRTARADIPFAVISQSGDTDMAARRARAEAILSLLDAPLRLPVNALGGIVTFGWISSVAAFEDQAGAGAVARYAAVYHAEYNV